MKGVRFFSDSLVMTEENESHRGQRERRGESESPSWRARNRGITEWKKREKERGGADQGACASDGFVPLRYPFSSDESIRRGLVSVNSGVGVSRTVG